MMSGIHFSHEEYRRTFDQKDTFQKAITVGFQHCCCSVIAAPNYASYSGKFGTMTRFRCSMNCDIGNRKFLIFFWSATEWDCDNKDCAVLPYSRFAFSWRGTVWWRSMKSTEQAGGPQLPNKVEAQGELVQQMRCVGWSGLSVGWRRGLVIEE